MTRQRALTSALALLTLCLCAGVFLYLGRGSSALARLNDAQGTLERDYSASVGSWLGAPLGSLFNFGDGVRTRESSHGMLIFDDGARLKLTPMTTVRFARSASEHSMGIDVEQGEAVLETGSREVKLQTEFGVAVLEAGTTLHLGKGARGLRLFVTIGRAELGDGEARVAVTPGHGVEIGIGTAVLERFTEPLNVIHTQAAAPPVSALPVNQVAVDAKQSALAVTIQGSKATLLAPGAKAYQPLTAGAHRLEPGSVVRLTATDRLHAEKDGATTDVSGAGSYRVVASESLLIEGAVGTYVLRTSKSSLELPIASGVVRVSGDSGLAAARVKVTSRNSGEVMAISGNVRVQLQGGEQILQPGEILRISRGNAVRSGTGPAYFDIAAQVGSSLIVHDPSPPTVVAFEFGQRCEGGLGIVETQASNAVTGTGAANVSLPAGKYRYRLRCVSLDGEVGAEVASGSVLVLRDSGISALPAKAPTSLVEVDGRSYTILYQNRLPQTTVSWPNAPPATGYRLSIKSAGTATTKQVSKPTAAFPPGALREGVHEFQFQTLTGRQSRMSQVTIAFDNVAPKASISAPVNAAFGPGESVAVSGIALPGWKVFVAGAELAQDEHQRFSGAGVAGPRGMVLRFSSPERGDHFYLRRIAGL